LALRATVATLTLRAAVTTLTLWAAVAFLLMSASAALSAAPLLALRRRVPRRLAPAGACLPGLRVSLSPWGRHRALCIHRVPLRGLVFQLGVRFALQLALRPPLPAVEATPFGVIVFAVIPPSLPWLTLPLGWGNGGGACGDRRGAL
jgi:hypothetical protein